MTKPLLKQTIDSKAFKNAYPNIYFEGNQLVGSLTIHAGDRVELINSMFSDRRYSSTYATSKPTDIHLATNSFKCDVEAYPDRVLAEYEADHLGYELSDEYIETDRNALKCKLENINTVFTVQNDNQIAGFYDVSLSLLKSKGEVTMVLNLNQIYVMPEYRGSTYWMDLTISVFAFVSQVLYEVAKKLPKPYYFDVCVACDFQSKSDEKIARIITSEIRMMYELLPEISAQRPAFIGGVSADMGY